MAEPTSTKPYLLRAMYEWCVDNGYTPHISVVVDAHTRVPMEYVRDGEIVINVGPLAASRLQVETSLSSAPPAFPARPGNWSFPSLLSRRSMRAKTGRACRSVQRKKQPSRR